MDLELQLQYKNLLVHHLERSEIEYELQVRAVQWETTESRSAIQRRLRDRLKMEREQNLNEIEISRLEKTVDEEIKTIDANLNKIRNYLERKEHFEGIRESLKTRLVHYFARARRIQEIAENDDDLVDLDKIVSAIRGLINTYFSPFSPCQTVRDEMLQQITDTISNLNVEHSSSVPSADGRRKSSDERVVSEKAECEHQREKP